MGHKQTKRYYDDTRQFNYWKSIKDHEENLAELSIKVDNFNKEKDFQDEQNVKTYFQSLAQQDYKYRQELKQFERSNQIADEQISFNRKAAHFAKDTLDEQAYERLVKFKFEAAGALLKYRAQQQKLRQGRRELLQGHGLATAKAAIQAQENLVKSLKKVGTATVQGGRGRSLQKNVDQWWGVSGREQAALLSMTQKANEQIGTKLYGIEYTMGVELQKRHLTKLAQRETKLSIERAHKRGTQEIINKWEGADMAANHKRLLEPEKGPAPILPSAMPRLHGASDTGGWRKTFKEEFVDPTTGEVHKIFDKSDVRRLGVYKPEKPGLGKSFREKHGIDKGDFSKDWKSSSWTRGPRFDYREDSGGAVGFGGTGARGTGISVGTVATAVGTTAVAAASIATMTATTAATAGIGFGIGSISAAVLGPIGIGIAAIGFIGTIFDWW